RSAVASIGRTLRVVGTTGMAGCMHDHGDDHEHDHERGGEVSSAAVRVLVDNHRQFLGFLERRVGSRAVAEDLLQEAFVRGLDKLDHLRSEESAIAWFYRVLRN